MNKRLLPVLFFFFFALTCLLINVLYPEFVIIAILGSLLALFPYYYDIWVGLGKRRLDLSFPPVITIFLLLVLRQARIALIFTIIILLGYLFKTYILERIKTSITAVTNKLPKTAFIKLGEEVKEVPISIIKPGDILVVKNGERLPTDAVLLSGEALLDESVVTGESKPVPKKLGEKLLAGSINVGDYFEAKAKAGAENSTLFQIQQLINKAQSEKSPFARVVNQYAKITSLIAFAGVLVIYFLKQNIIMALSFWIALVPVIFAIIVPVATTIGIVILAKKGILVKNGASLENLTKVKTFLFDKTGTITQGKPEVEEILGVQETENKVLQLAASLEKFSNHPFSLPILEKAKEKKLETFPVKETKTFLGKGMVAVFKKEKVFLGNMSLLEDLQINVNKDLLAIVDDREKRGASTVFVGRGARIVGVIFLVDKLRPEVKTTFSVLSQNGGEEIIVTGDKKEVAEAIARNLQNVTFVAEITPEKKVMEVEKRVEAGKFVAMIGDGINDAPALAKAHVGIAFAEKGVDLTLNAADIVLLNNNLASIPQIIEISKKTFAIIKQDVVLASVIHLATAIFVLIGEVSLLQTTIIHEISSVLVLLNTLRLFHVREEIEKG